MNVAVVTVCNHANHPGLARLDASCRYWGWDFLPIVTEWQGFATKLRALKQFIPKLYAMNYTHVLFTDAYDTIANGPANAVIPHLSAGCLLSAEIAPWPPVGLESRYPKTESRWKYVNSGGYLCEIGYLQDVILDGVDNEPMLPLHKAIDPVHANDDQLWMTWKFLDNPILCKLDYRCEVFQTLGHTIIPAWGPEWDWPGTYEVRGDRVYNRQTSTYPLFIHGNGGADMTWIPEVK